MTHFWNLGSPLISRETLKLETSNLPRRRTAVSSNEKNAQLYQQVVMGDTYLTVGILGPLIFRER